MEVLRTRSLLRARLLSTAVRVKPNYLPQLAQVVEKVSECFRDDKPVEAYVFGSQDVNGFIADLVNHRVIGLSSGALNTLTMQEVAFVIGHEMGHSVFGHTDYAVGTVLQMGGLSVGQTRLLRSWQRACEISADRAALVFCNSLEVAANALFKTLAGLPLPNIQIDPHEFADQWSSLANEVMEHGGREFWQLEHPFPPLRMKAMQIFWRERNSSADAEIGRLLGMMEDTTSATAVGVSDPVLAKFQFWGGLYVILADGKPNPHELEHLQQNLPVGLGLEQVLESFSNDEAYCLERFQEAKRTRKMKLSAGELHKIIHGVVAAATVDGELNQLERSRLYELGMTLGLRTEAIDLILSKAEEQCKNGG